MYEDYNLDRSKCSCVFIEYSITRPKIMEEYNLCRSSMMNRLYHINPIRARHTLMIMALPLRNHTILPLRSNTVPLLQPARVHAAATAPKKWRAHGSYYR